MSAAAHHPIYLRLGTRVAVLGSLLVVAVWLAAARGWMEERQEELDAQPLRRGAELRATLLGGLERELAQPLVSLDQALITARAQAEALAALRETRRGRRLVEEPRLEELVRRELVAVVDELGAADAAWLRDGATLLWRPHGAPVEAGGAPLDGPCLLQEADSLRLAHCRELPVGDEDSPRLAGVARDIAPATLAPAGFEASTWGFFAARPGQQSLVFVPAVAMGVPATRPAFEDWCRVSGWTPTVTELPAFGAVLVDATAPAHRLAADELLVGQAGPLTFLWQRWSARTGGIAFAAILFFCFLGWRINAAFAPVVAAARSLGAEDLDARVPVERSDEIGAIAAVLNDLSTSLKHARRNWEREARLAAWRDVARGLAHEIKNPLTPIRGTVENLLRWRAEEPERFDAHCEARLGTILEEVGQLTRLASAFSDFAKLPPPQKELADLNEILRAVAGLQLGDREGLALEERLDDSLAPVAFDAGQIRQVVTNLTKNAREALGEGGGRVRIESGRHGRGAWFAVSDAGPGVDEASLDQLFVPGWSTRKHEGGSGLGLWLCHRIVLEHDGTIEASRSELGGLRIRVTLPEG